MGFSDLQEECPECLDTGSIFNGKEMVSCPLCKGGTVKPLLILDDEDDTEPIFQNDREPLSEDMIDEDLDE